MKPALADLRDRCSRPLPPKEGVEPTNLFSRNADVNRVNDTRLGALPGDEVSRMAVDFSHPLDVKQSI